MSFLRTAISDEPPPPVKPRKEQIERDFAMLAGKVNYVRTYRATDGGDVMPEIAARNGLKLVPGAWIYSANEAKQQFGREASEVNAEETRALIRMANQNPNIERVLVGNENILRWDGQKDLRDPNATSPAQLIREIRNVKRNVKVPVSTAEPWHVWLNYPELAREVDYLAVHILPYWDEKSSETPLEYLKSQDRPAARRPTPNKNIIVTEVGWPSNGAARRSPGSGRGQVRDAGRAGQERPRHGGVAEVAEHRVLRGRGDRPAVEVLRPRRQGRRLLGPVECRPPAEVRLDRPDRDVPAMVGGAPPGRSLLALPLMLVFLWRWPDLGTAGQLALLRPGRAVDQRARLWRRRSRPAPTW